MCIIISGVNLVKSHKHSQIQVEHLKICSLTDAGIVIIGNLHASTYREHFKVIPFS